MRKKPSVNNDILLQFEPLIHKTLLRMHILSSHIYYDDYCQELRLKLLDLAAHFQGEPLKDERYQFVAFASKGLYWYLLDLLKREKAEIPLEAKTIEMTIDASVKEGMYQSSVAIISFLASMEKVLSIEEQAFFWLLNDQSLTLKEIASYYDISVPAVHKRKAKIQGKLAPLKNILKN